LSCLAVVWCWGISVSRFSGVDRDIDMEDLLHLNMELDDYALDGVLAGIGVGFWILRYQNAIETEENGVRIPRLGLPFV
jgi:hypothetical protein